MCVSELPLILVVDDDVEISRLVALMLERAGYKAVASANGQEAIKVCAHLPAAPDLLIADVVMPDPTGPDLYSALRNQFGIRRCLFMSSFPAEWLGQLPRAPDCLLLPKPFTSQQLLAAVTQVLGQQVM